MYLYVRETGRTKKVEMDEAKLFVGGIAWDTKENTLRDYFVKYGEVTEVLIVKDKNTGYSRGFGFVVFSESSILDALLGEKHTIDGRTVCCFFVLFQSGMFLCTLFADDFSFSSNF